MKVLTKKQAQEACSKIDLFFWAEDTFVEPLEPEEEEEYLRIRREAIGANEGLREWLNG